MLCIYFRKKIINEFPFDLKKENHLFIQVSKYMYINQYSIQWLLSEITVFLKGKVSRLFAKILNFLYSYENELIGVFKEVSRYIWEINAFICKIFAVFAKVTHLLTKVTLFRKKFALCRYSRQSYAFIPEK